MFNPFKYSRTIEQVTCPNCLTSQGVHGSTLSIFCKNCRTRIDIKRQAQKTSGEDIARQWKPKTKTISCPYCHSLQDVLATALSSYCKNCNQRITIKEDTKTDLSTQIPITQKKDINCPHCGNKQEVPSTALSSFCPDCGNRINLQNYEIKGRFRGDLDTKGLVYISDDGVVEGNINTGALIVAGRFKGEVIAEERVEIKSTARLYGKIRAPALRASSGAVFIGHLHIGK